MKTRFRTDPKFTKTPVGYGGSPSIEIRRPEPARKRPVSKPARISGKVTTLGDLLDRAVLRLDRAQDAE
jgi:hypothetical protein